ncbi:tetratricopeptide repeat protein [Limibacter armeniacum]|uniref:tetratricopeptide repeat protein n=1 Tax=Limibacter armeniacum TaxID=466084 RepID=UPI002FE59871
MANLAKAQPRLPKLEDVDMLLTNVTVQIEITSGIDAMYNFDFKVAESQFNWLKQHYPDHPLPYFLIGLNYWWQIMPNVENSTYDKEFFNYMDKSISLAETMHKQHSENPEASFFLAAAWAFKARLLGERHDWTKATVASKTALTYFNETKELAGEGELGSEMFFGDGLYNYYVEWLKENYKVLRPVLWFFEDGNKELGLEQLEKAGSEAFYTRIEAMYYLVRIHSTGDGNIQRALQLIEYLHQKYPKNAYFHRFYARILYQLGKYSEMRPVAASLLKNVEEKKPGYEAISGRYAAFYLASYYHDYIMDRKQAAFYYYKTVQFAEEIKEYESGYYLFSLRKLGRIAKSENMYDIAKDHYDKLLKYADRNSSLHKEARKFKKEYKQWKKSNHGKEAEAATDENS